MIPPLFIQVSAGLVFHHQKLLITQRCRGSHLAGLWEFPGGKKESDETFEDCLVRELKEELGITVEVGPLLDTVQHQYPEKNVWIQFYRCRLVEGEPSPIGCDALAWITQDQLDNYPFPAADAQLLNQLRASPDWWL